MRAWSTLSMLMLAVTAVAAPAEARGGKDLREDKARCASYGFEEGTDAFAECVMQRSLKRERRNPDRDTLIRRYRDSSMARRGDDRYPVCTAGMMDNELDTSTGKWVGPSCQMKAD